MTPFMVSSFIETIRSEAIFGSDDIRVMDVLTNGINRLKLDFFGPRDNSKRFPLIYLAIPTSAYHTLRYFVTKKAHEVTFGMATRYVNRKPASEKTAFHQFMPQMFASMTSVVIADLICYPFETVLHRLYVQGTRTLIDNLDNGMAAISIGVKYAGIIDCIKNMANREGICVFYSGIGALALQYMLNFCVLRSIRSIYDYGTRAFARAQFGRVTQSDGNLSDQTSVLKTPVTSYMPSVTSSAAVNTRPLSGNNVPPFGGGFTSPFGTSSSQPFASLGLNSSQVPSSYPTFGQTSAAFTSRSPPRISSPNPSHSDRPLSSFLSALKDTAADDPFGTTDYRED
ncbi:hypothetical protein AB6A40_001976 [Gnathostoma spinigerum]|uniref:Solute carrier family 25 member 46 n=1 Tax=Gnathostoma spinigerum TaxID=75299 RepID=A0ABD6E7L5_9BILA